LPPLGEIIRHQSYLRRLSAVQALSLMATVMNPPGFTVTEILPLVLMMATDNVSFIIVNHNSFKVLLTQLTKYLSNEMYRIRLQILDLT
jgi:hypothetical protein